MANLIAEIAAASNEQAHGIGEVNAAVSEMDKVVQQNAATAEESASASQEMNAQADKMKSSVEDLVVLIEGRQQTKMVAKPSQRDGVIPSDAIASPESTADRTPAAAGSGLAAPWEGKEPLDEF